MGQFLIFASLALSLISFVLEAGVEEGFLLFFGFCWRVRCWALLMLAHTAAAVAFVTVSCHCCARLVADGRDGVETVGLVCGLLLERSGVAATRGWCCGRRLVAAPSLHAHHIGSEERGNSGTQESQATFMDSL